MKEVVAKNPERDGEKIEIPFRTQYIVRLPLGDVTKAVAQPGWKWSTHIKPLVGGELCMVPHFGVIIEGSITILQDGVETVCKAGDVFYMPAGHDAWVNEGPDVVMYEFNQSNLLNHNK